MILEFCAENFTNVAKAIEEGVHRIELCDNLAQGGTTPSYAVIEQTVTYANQHHVQVVTMIRPRGGNFVFSVDELNMMKKDLKIAKQLHADGVVFGCLTAQNMIDRAQTKALIDLSGEMETTFHMAFDFIPKNKQKEELDWLIAQGVTRILTRGGEAGNASNHAEWLQELIEYADGRIEILVGGGITWENVNELASVLATNQFHGSKIVNLDQ